MARGDAEPEGSNAGELGLIGGGTCFLDHGPDGQFAGPVPGRGLVAVDEEKLVDTVGSCGQQVTSESEQVPVS